MNEFFYQFTIKENTFVHVPKTNIIKISQTLQLFCKKKTYLIKNFMQNNQKLDIVFHQKVVM